jgi:hypothetical protein
LAAALFPNRQLFAFSAPLFVFTVRFQKKANSFNQQDMGSRKEGGAGGRVGKRINFGIF